jgi:ABC-type transporter Mla subunit MlaD
MQKNGDSLARAAGYAGILGFTVLAGIVAESIRRETAEPLRIIRVHFAQLGTLMEDDPVVQEGVSVGKVRSLGVDGIGSVVELEMFRKGDLPRDSRFVNFNHSLMGARMVVLVPGHAGEKMDESVIQEGRFAGGVAETVHRVNDLLSLVITLRKETLQLFTGPKAPFAPAGLPKRMDDAMRNMEKFSREAEKAGQAFKSGLKAFETTGQNIRRDVRDTRETLNPAWARLESSFRSTVAVEKAVAAALDPMESLLKSVRNSESGIHALFYDRKAYDRLETTLKTLEKALLLLEDDGLTDAIHFRNLHFFEPDSR